MLSAQASAAGHPREPGPGWDVAVIGAGPAGLSAATACVAAGARTIVLERARHPRYKTCGGGLIGASLTAADGHGPLPERDRILVGADGSSGIRRSVRAALSMLGG